MADIGKLNTLKIAKAVDFGIYLDGGVLGEILLPKRYIPAGAKVGDRIEVFLYFDSDDRLIATTEKPLAMVGDFAYLKVKAVNAVGAFLDWGLSKDLLVPFREQHRPQMREGHGYCVFLYLDAASRRIAASAKLSKFLNTLPVPFVVGQEVGLLIYEKTELGYKAIVENSHSGVLYKNEVFRDLALGQRIRGYIHKIREDGKIDLRLDKPGYGKVGYLTEAILKQIADHGGFLEVTDRSSPAEIAALFGASKKAFKMAVGALYKQRLITIEANGLRLV
ncbi:MAG: S1-like domain-containing RNA-binding protein [Candidatus Aminicenantes bacterium]|nr:S1-like domain-containing RNA-binding protein [Candidatus Aminicenantes bacterium]